MNKAFDIEAFNYLIDRDSCLINGKIAKQSFLKYQYILDKIAEIDPVYLEILHCTRKEKVVDEDGVSQGLLGGMGDMIVGGGVKKDFILHSALHAAFRDGNNRVVDSILQKMSEISTDNSEMFSEILPELTDL